MHESTGSPSTRTVHAPQWPSLHATFVPVSPIRSRSASASEVSAGASTVYVPPFTRKSGSYGHRLDVGQVDEACRQAAGLEALRFAAEVGPCRPQVACRLEQLAHAIDRVRVAVALGTRVDREPEHPER